MMINFLTDQERDQLVFGFNDTKVDYPQDKTMVDLFEELNQKANQLAHYLRERYEIKPDDLVGVCITSSVEMIVGILGILKAGAAYVPIDSNYPEQRIDFMIKDSKLKLVLSDSNSAGVLDFQENLKVIPLDKSWENISKEPFNEPNRDLLTGSNLVYVIYTSGSTGKPKGVMMPHSSMVNLILHHSKLDIPCQKVLHRF